MQEYIFQYIRTQEGLWPIGQMLDYPNSCLVEAQRRKERKTRVIVSEISVKGYFFRVIHLRSESSVFLDTAASASNFAVNSLCIGDKQRSFKSITYKRDIYSF